MNLALLLITSGEHFASPPFIWNSEAIKAKLICVHTNPSPDTLLVLNPSILALKHSHFLSVARATQTILSVCAILFPSLFFLQPLVDGKLDQTRHRDLGEQCQQSLATASSISFLHLSGAMHCSYGNVGPPIIHHAGIVLGGISK